jgi:phage gp29-like protein
MAETEKLTAPEVGITGNVSGWGGRANFISGEHLRTLEGPAGRLIYDKMRRSDHQVQAVLRAITLPIRQADYYMKPASEDEQDKKIAETLQRALLKEMTTTWDDTMRHALLMLPFGFSPLEKVYEYRDGLILPRKLDPRLPQSVARWKYDEKKRRITDMVQWDPRGKEIPIPIEKLLVFTTDKEGDHWEGISILRAAYKAWFIKDDLEKTNAIMHARWGAGLPEFKAPQGVEKGSEEWEAAKEALEDIHANEKAYIETPYGWEFKLHGGEEGEGTKVLDSIRYYDEAIAKAMLAMHINLGTSATGSRALGQSFISAFLMATQAWADYIAEVINRFCVKELVDLNWKVKRYPHFLCKRIHGLDLQAIGYLAQAGVITNTRDLENDLREVLRLPEIADAEEWKTQQQRRKEAPAPAGEEE